MLSKIRKWLHSPAGVRVQVLSDLHLEVADQYATYTFPVAAPFLLLAGDIGRLIDYDSYLKFLVAQVSRFDKVFLILGNHEFYGLGYQSGLDQAQRFTEEPTLQEKLVLLHKSRWDDPDSNLTILGCTLWSSVPDEALDIVKIKISDFKKIQNWTVHDHNRVHLDELRWLRDQVSQAKQGSDRTILVATHHAPCVEGASRPEHAQNPWTSAFTTELLSDDSFEGVKFWVFGHTHYTTRFAKRGIEVVANQREYVLPGSSTHLEGQSATKAKKEKNTFDPSCTIRI
ncbi:unnamed protein product [Clonostachys rosea]|uniref:Calcineurin-like phosphoesterase domain-containing protein n=1 Tax=Bionectria ochroleuca TaxID=29856 RepID=A0ABY6TRT7_BIOOC|nr:unnamed protein product [Clonostachys rosea]